MVVQMMRIAIEVLLLIPTLGVQVHSHTSNICAEIMQIIDVLLSNHFHHSLNFPNLSDIDKIQAVFVLLDLRLGCIYLDWGKWVLDMHSICRRKNIKQLSTFRILE
jgi:hypothetical protein